MDSHGRLGLRRQSTVLASACLVVAAVLPFVQALHAARWIVAALLGIAAGSVFARELLVHREERTATRHAILRTLRCEPTTVASADRLALGVSPSEIAERFATATGQAPYVRRDRDDEIDCALRQQSFVVLVGASKAGKTRTLFEALRRTHPNATIVAPAVSSATPESLMELTQDHFVRSSGHSLVIWLDDLHEYLRAGAVTIAVINAWLLHDARVLVVGTMRARELADLRVNSAAGPGAKELRAEIGAILDRATQIPLATALTRAELASAERLYPGEDFTDGLGVHLVAGPQLVERYVAAEEACPEGHAVVTAAIDLMRVGLGLVDPITLDDLTAFVPHYWKVIRPHTVFSRAVIERGIAWATKPVLHDIALIVQSQAPTEGARPAYRPFDYIVAFRDGEVGSAVGRADVPDATWALALSRARTTQELGTLGLSAATHGRLRSAHDAFSRLVEMTTGADRATARLYLAYVLLDLGDETAARAALEETIEDDFADSRPVAAYVLASVLELHDGVTAETYYRIAIAGDDARVRGKAAVNLGLLIRERAYANTTRYSDGETSGVSFATQEPTAHTQAADDEARELFEIALASGDQEAIANGGNALGVLEAMHLKVVAAEAAFARSMEAGCLEGHVNYASLLIEHGRQNEVRALLDRTRSDGNLSAAQIAILELNIARASNAGAEAMAAGCETVRRLAAPDPGLRQHFLDATLQLAQIELERNNPTNGTDLLREIVSAGAPPFAAIAAETLSAVREASATRGPGG